MAADGKLTQMKEAFCLFDRDADGLIHAKDFPILIRSLGINPPQTELDKMMKGKEDAMLKFEDFAAMAGDAVNKADPEADLLKAFKNFDRDNNGTVSASELKHVMLNLGDRLTEDEVNELIAIGDPSGTGSVAYKTFVAKLLAKF